jgi:hypothetical protein
MKEYDVTANQADATEATQPLGRSQKLLIGAILIGVVGIAAIGFAGSYHSVTALARAKGFGWFANWFTIGVDAGIGVLLALDLLLTWLRIPFPLLRPAAWFLTGATIVFNAAAAWPDYLGSGMHGVIPVLFVISVEAARHAIGRLANIAVDRHVESPPLSRWLVDPVGAFRIWRRQRQYNIRSYDEVIEQRRQVRVYIARLRGDYGRRWRRLAPAEKLLILTLAAEGMTVEDAIALPEKEAERRRQAEFERQEEARTAEAARQEEARLAEEKRLAAEAEQRRQEREEREAAELAAVELQRRQEQLRREQQIADAEAEAERLNAVENQRRRSEQEERERRLADAKLDEQLAEIERARREADEQLAAEKWEREQEQRRDAAETAERIATAAKANADAVKAQREEASRLREIEAVRRQLAARKATEATPTGATARASSGDSAPPTGATTGGDNWRQNATASGDSDSDSSAARSAPVRRQRPPRPVAKKTPGRRSLDEWVEVAGPVFHAEFQRLRRNPTANEFATAIKAARLGDVSDSTAKNIRAEILDRTELPALD